MDDFDKRLLGIATRLLEKTRAGEIEWAQTDEENSFLYSGTATSAIITRDPVDEYDVALRILNERGTEIARLSCGFYDDWDENGREVRVWREQNRFLVDLYQAALRNALNVEGALSSLLDDLA